MTKRAAILCDAGAILVGVIAGCIAGRVVPVLMGLLLDGKGLP